MDSQFVMTTYVVELVVASLGLLKAVWSISLGRI